MRQKKKKIWTCFGIQKVFYKMFCKLNFTNVIELACGRGRHVTRYKEKANMITLVDVLQKILIFAKIDLMG